ncbi:hypothetical protein E2C01_048971 [Portunus trituberculatus]|uniref:Uncharacterized protein n=1 Tax=Portunus trituberculatus TaxID=210409 RepID=A0A5B7G4F3_PORTR|nr:hypothetical protein [Portunus trituberculatus]
MGRRSVSESGSEAEVERERERESGDGDEEVYLKSLSPKRIITGVNTLPQVRQGIKCELLSPVFIRRRRRAGLRET